LDLEVLLRLNLLLQTVHLHVQFSELLVQLLIVLNYLILLLFLGLRHLDGDNRLVLLLLLGLFFDLLLCLLSGISRRQVLYLLGRLLLSVR